MDVKKKTLTLDPKRGKTELLFTHINKKDQIIKTRVFDNDDELIEFIKRNIQVLFTGQRFILLKRRNDKK